MPLDEKPFRSESESNEPAEAYIRMSHPRVRPHVAPADGRSGNLTKADFVTSFLVAGQLMVAFKVKGFASKVTPA